ncbi:MmcQ/YjbR family DNA-binding protein [Butyrivibrio sp.]|uniref:MmcQ/YjbR family DNA-binding protein n=1 Tax=Butyrivibrio sp. TaxID=28121 RepID=UPI0025C0D416|nr:MmcQ/YjbR family DNA-binding protein [Butyrivibrio sp.]MBE5838408.1 MmcQ protein [Butyrivibrio sp.]
MTSIREEVVKYIKKKYKASPENLWRSYPDYAVFRHDDNRKWFAIIMDVDADKLGIPRNDRIDIIDIKIDDLMLRDILLQQEGYLPGYHMNKQKWITIMLDGSVDLQQVCRMIDASFLDTASKKKKDKFRQPKEWIVPANPKYYDIEAAFDAADEIDWKQGAGIIKGDTVFMYVGAPVSAILYKCKVTEVDIPYDYEDKNLKITALMKIKLLKRYKRDEFTFERLKSEYGIYAVRGPRGIPNTLSAALK